MAFRALARPAACLLLGAATTYAIAVIAINTNTACIEGRASGFPNTINPAYGEFRPGSESYVLLVIDDETGYSDAQARDSLQRAESRAFNANFPGVMCGTGLPSYTPTAIDTAGLPFRCIWCWRAINYGAAPSVATPQGGAWIWPRKPTSRVPGAREFAYLLPYRLRPAGFAANTAILASAFWLLSLAPSSIRKSLRRRRNLCTNCAYDLSATPTNLPCPECGHQPQP